MSFDKLPILEPLESKWLSEEIPWICLQVVRREELGHLQSQGEINYARGREKIITGIID
jgi:hypothetical protein